MNNHAIGEAGTSDAHGGGLGVWDGATAVVTSTQFAANFAYDDGAAAWVSGSGSEIDLWAAAIVDHSVAGTPGVVTAEDGGEALIYYTTFAGNLDASGDHLLRARTSATLGLYSSLVAETSGTVFDVTGATGDADCVLAHEIGTMPISASRIGPATPATSLIAQPSGADVHLVPDSPAIDFCAGGGPPPPLDLDGEARGFDVVDHADLYGPFDIGIDEWIPSSEIFSDGFESGDTSAWS